MKVSERAARDFLRLHRIAVAGASDNPQKMGMPIYKELKERGYDVVAVNPSVATVQGDPSYPDLASVPGGVEGVVVVVSADKALGVVEEASGLGIRSVWLFKGAGKGAVSDEAVDLCRRHGIDVVAGACPLMFFEPTAWIHRAHRTMRHLNRSLQKAA